MRRAMLLKKYLKFALLLNILVAILCLSLLFITTDTYGIYAESICAVSALFNCIGLTLLIRWHFNGVFLVSFASVASAISISVTCAAWLQVMFGDVGLFIPYIICLIYLLILVLLLFQKTEGKYLWKTMNGGFDYSHFRHIYQTSIVVIISIITIAYVSLPEYTNNDSGNDSNLIISNVTLSSLDSPKVTIDEVLYFEKYYNDKYDINERDKNVSKRLFALKHLLLSGLMPEIHDRDNLINIFVLHAGDFSEEQQVVIDWYLSLPLSDQEEWNICRKASSLSDFKNVIERKLR